MGIEVLSYGVPIIRKQPYTHPLRQSCLTKRRPRLTLPSTNLGLHFRFADVSDDRDDTEGRFDVRCRAVPHELKLAIRGHKAVSRRLRNYSASGPTAQRRISAPSPYVLGLLITYALS